MFRTYRLIVSDKKVSVFEDCPNVILSVDVEPGELTFAVDLLSRCFARRDVKFTFMEVLDNE